MGQAAEGLSHEASALLEQWRADGVRTVIVGGADTHGVMRGKRIPIDQMSNVLAHGMPLCDVFWVMHIDESDLVPRPDDHVGYFPTEKLGYPDIVAIPDLATARMVPWHESTALLLGDWHLPHGAGPVPIAPRDVLSRVVQRARELGFVPFSALELEFYLLREPRGATHTKRAAELEPMQQAPSTYGVVLGSHQEEIASAIREGMIAYGLPIEACNPETGPGQFEINLRYDESLTAADHAFLFKSAVKEVAAQHDLLATFMAKPNQEWAGNSAHLHMSLRDEHGTPVFFDEAAPDGISTTMRYFIGGLLATMRELSPVMAPTVNSYRRYSPYSWAGTTATWGIDNRSTGVRAILEGPFGTRVEQRQAGGDVNPYLATAAVLAAGLRGIAEQIEPADAIDADVYAMPEGAVETLPRSLNEAVEALDGSQMARELLGTDFVNHFVAMKRGELAQQALAVTDWEISRYLEAL